MINAMNFLKDIDFKTLFPSWVIMSVVWFTDIDLILRIASSSIVFIYTAYMLITKIYDRWKKK
jgi:hypothetical protein